MAFPLSVPYHEKDQVKRLGATWNADQKLWIIPDYVNDINPFKKWFPEPSDCIVRKPYLLCVSKRNCWYCHKETPMVALAAKNYFYFDGEWIRATSPTLFRFVTGIEEKVLAYLEQFYPFFQPKYSQTTKSTYYANTCTYCNGLQGDFHNHEDFGGAFLFDPFKPAPRYVKLIPIDIPFDYQIYARYCSMAYDPIFFPERVQNTANQKDKIKVIIF